MASNTPTTIAAIIGGVRVGYSQRSHNAKPIEIVVKLPRTEQVFHGWLFTGNGLALAGYSKLQDREAGFYATRVEEE